MPSVIKRAINTYKKYNSFSVFYYIVRWCMQKCFAKMLAYCIKLISSDQFELQGKTDFKELYSGNCLEESQRILNGERQILYYSNNDENRLLDIKNRWEINRCQHLPVLTLANQFINIDDELDRIFREDYFEVIMYQSNAMEVSISTINLIISFQNLNSKQRKKYNYQFKRFLKRSLAYIIENNEKAILYSHNHYFFDLIGAIWICESIRGNIFLKIIKKSLYKKLESWLKLAIQKDGSLYEASTYYHRYVLESLLIFTNEFSPFHKNPFLLKYIRNMSLFCRSVSVNNHIVGIGDNDSGRLLPLPSYFSYKSNQINTINFLNKNIGIESKDGFLKSNVFGLYHVFNDTFSGWLRLEEQTKFKYRKVVGVHGHNDQLSIQLFFKNHPILLHKGVYSYIQHKNCRIDALKTSSHNTISVNNLEQGQIYNSFKYVQKSHTAKILVETKDYCKGSLDVNNKYTHTREARVSQNAFIITDRVQTVEQDAIIKIYFHFHPQIKLLQKSDRELVLTYPHKLSFRSNMGIFKIRNYIYSPEYGSKVTSSKAILEIVVPFPNSYIEIKSVIRELL